MEYGLIGEKLGHSFSKTIHEKLADYTYDLHPLAKEEVASFFEKKQFFSAKLLPQQNLLPI